MTSKRKKLSDDHKQALAEGRAEGKLVRGYLEALEQNKPKRGRRRTKDTIEKRLEKLDQEIQAASSLKRLQLTQERLDLAQELENMDTGTDISELEDDFVSVAKEFAARKNITYAAFRQIGVPAAVLRRAGISRAG